MRRRIATLKRGAVVVSLVVSSYAVFGHDAWAPEPMMLTQSLGSTNGASAAGYYVNSGGAATVLKWPGSWTAGSLVSGTPCSTTALPAGVEAHQVIERQGNYARCTTWFAEGARLEEALSGTDTPATARTLDGDLEVEVVLFPATWTYDPDVTVTAETYCSPWAAPAGTAVGTFIVRFGDHAKCSY